MSTPVIESTVEHTTMVITRAPTVNNSATPVIHTPARTPRAGSRATRVLIALGKGIAKLILVLAVLLLFTENFSRGIVSGLIDSGSVMPIFNSLSTGQTAPR